MSINNSRRDFFRRTAHTAGAAATLAMLPPSIRKALAVPANNRLGTIEDVEHIVVFMQENRSFDHYFGTLHGVRGFADRFPIPVADTDEITGKTVWYQRNDAAEDGAPKVLAPQHNNTENDFALMRTAMTPHLFPDAQDAWDHGRLSHWPQYKTNASMVYFREKDMPFQFALANAFTICDANFCSFMGGTNPNRTFVYTGNNFGHDTPADGVYNGPAMDNSYNTWANGEVSTGYTWTTYAERLQDAGISWRVYQDNEVEFYALNSLFGFKNYRETIAPPAERPFQAAQGLDARQTALFERGVQTNTLEKLKQDVLNGTLPQVSWICATSSGSEHPSPSSPAQGAEYTAQVLEALTANPEVWSKTVLIMTFDENDGLFDHVPPPVPPSYADDARSVKAGDSTVDTSGDYLGEDTGGIDSVIPYIGRPFGMGPRVPMYIISPWSKGGWVNSQVFDHTSVIRFIEARFGVQETNITPWRRAVAGDLTSCFNFATPNDTDLVAALPETAELDARSRELPGTKTPDTPATPSLPVQDAGSKPSRALPYELHTSSVVTLGQDTMRLIFSNTGTAGALFHVYDRKHLDAIPRRYTVEAGKQLTGEWNLAADAGAYDLWVLGPNGFHRHFTGTRGISGANPEVQVCYDVAAGDVYLKVHNTGTEAVTLTITPNAYFEGQSWTLTAEPGKETQQSWSLRGSGNWYDFTVTAADLPGYSRRFAGRVENGKDSISDPAMGGVAIGDQVKVG